MRNIYHHFLALFLTITACDQPPTKPAGTIDQGPYLGHISDHNAKVWVRMSQPGLYKLWLEGEKKNIQVFPAEALTDTDQTVHFRLNNLNANAHYRYYLTDAADIQLDSTIHSFTTDPPVNQPQRLKLAWISCADDKYESNFHRWDGVKAQSPHVLVLLGDTPYIDSTRLSFQYQRYRHFNAVPQYTRLLKEVSFYGTWDDHDLGRDDADGTLKDKQNARKAFMAYRPNPSYGNGSEGIYTSFRKGPLEVFLLDTRWFSGTEPSPVMPDSATLLGKAQWEWLQQGLLASEAPFKVLASGMIWNDAVRSGKTDYWGAYKYERDSLFRFIADHHIDGVVLLGGDIHRSRLIRHDIKKWEGYPLYEIISSPLHTGVIESANVDHPGLLFDLGEAGAFVITEVDNTTEHATMSIYFRTNDGKLHYKYKISSAELNQTYRP